MSANVEKEPGPQGEKEPGPQPADQSPAVSPGEPEKKKREYKEFGHDDDKPTRELLLCSRYCPNVSTPIRCKG
jgi:H+-transporting ATPase